MSTLVLGAGGMLGHKLWQRLSAGRETVGTIRGPGAAFPLEVSSHARIVGGVDVRRFDRVAEVIRDVRPSVVVNCVGIVKQRPEAGDAETLFAVNSVMPVRLAWLCRAEGIRLIQLSTDCVFSGARGAYSERDVPDPVDLYGESKLAGEVGAPGALTVRTSMVGRELSGASGLLEWLVSSAGTTVRGYTNAIFSGLTTPALARLIERVIDEAPTVEGVRHVAAKPIDKCMLLTRLRDVLGLDVRIEPDDGVTIDRSLDGSRFATETGIDVPSWDDMLEGMAADPTPYMEMRNR